MPIAEYRYEYDSLGRLIRSSQADDDESTVMRTEHLYDENNRLTEQSYEIGGDSFTESYTYDEDDGSLSSMTTANGDGLSFAYDAIKRLETVTTDGYTRSYTYRNLSGNQTTTQISALNYRGLSNTTSFQYTYNKDGSIATAGKNGGTATRYTYDSLGQLITAVDSNLDLYYSYDYDTAGNIRQVTAQGMYHSSDDYANTYTYGYTGWADLLTAFNGQKIAYEGQSYNAATGNVTGTVVSGNPTSYYNGTRWNFSWEGGRTLASAANGSTAISYDYDLNNLRTEKTVTTATGTVHSEYIYASGRLLRETRTTTNGVEILDFSYDSQGTPYALTYSVDNGTPTTYYYITNLQGDVMYMVDEDGDRVASYAYDPYGAITSISGTMSQINPLRYRGYYYDSETGFYYLQSRYYDPSIGRFINVDEFASTGQGFVGYNMFVYCSNNPVNRCDPIIFCSI